MGPYESSTERQSTNYTEKARDGWERLKLKGSYKDFPLVKGKKSVSSPQLPDRQGVGRDQLSSFFSS